VEILNIKGITKKYANHQALTDISLSVPEQSIFGLLGPNGAGKTTLIRIVNQIINSDEGEIIIDGELLNQKHIEIIGYLPEERGLYKKMKVGEQLMYFAQLKGLSSRESKNRIKEWLKKFDIIDWWNKKLEDLSKGMAQKIQFISTVIHNPKLIILDEPFSGFDPVNANIIKNEILELRDNGATILFSTHRMESVEELCDHIALINNSYKIIDGSKKEIKNKFRTNTYNIEYRGNLSGQNGNYTILNREKIEDDFERSTIQLNNGFTTNDLLGVLINEIEISSFIENIPSMNDIFIEIVKKAENE
jgi:ABC-2 type transport system ATP-binding protein